MATSNVYSVQYSRDQLITAGLRKLGVLGESQVPSPQNLLDGSMALNMVVGLLRAKGMPMWARATYTFSTTPTILSYTIGTGQTFDTPYPLKMLQAYRSSNGTVIDMDVEPDYNFNQLPTSSSGIPLKLAYQALNNYGIIKLWPTPDTTVTDSTFTIVYQRPFQYFNTSTDTMDFPEEWYLPLVYNLAVVLAPEWGVPLPDRQMLSAQADKFTEEVLGMGGEDASMFIQPYRQTGWGHR